MSRSRLDDAIAKMASSQHPAKAVRREQVLNEGAITIPGCTGAHLAAFVGSRPKAVPAAAPDPRRARHQGSSR